MQTLKGAMSELKGAKPALCKGRMIGVISRLKGAKPALCKGRMIGVISRLKGAKPSIRKGRMIGVGRSTLGSHVGFKTGSYSRWRATLSFRPQLMVLLTAYALPHHRAF